MSKTRAFISQDYYGQSNYKHKKLPVYIADQFNFCRCVEFKIDFYGKTASCLFNGNLRECTGRYSKLFLNQKLSYWADSAATAEAEIKKHGAGDSMLTFWAYDDGTSTFPTLPDQSPLVIIDGRECGVQELIDKADNDISLTETEQAYMKSLLATKPDCLVFDSHAKEGGECYIFFEKGFRKLSLRDLQLRLSREYGSRSNKNKIVCAGGCDYSPYVECYGEYFEPKVRIKMDKSYLKTDEYLMRKRIYEQSHLLI